MDETNSIAVLRRKARSGQKARDSAANSPSKALRLAVSRAAKHLWDLPLGIDGVQHDVMAMDDALAVLEDTWLLLLLEGPEGRLGVLSLDQQVMSGMIEAQTIGQVAKTIAPSRDMTRTDAAMIAPFVEGALLEFSENLNESGTSEPSPRFRYAVKAENVRALGLVLNAEEFEVFRMTASLADGAKSGDIALILPLPDRPAVPSSPDMGCAPERATFQDTVMMSQATLDAVLCRIRKPLSEIGDLKPGDILPIPAKAIGETRLEAGNRALVARVKLGQFNGSRAVRLLGEATSSHPETSEMSEQKPHPAAIGQEDTPDDRATPAKRTPQSPRQAVDPSKEALDGSPSLPEQMAQDEVGPLSA